MFIRFYSNNHFRKHVTYNENKNLPSLVYGFLCSKKLAKESKFPLCTCGELDNRAIFCQLSLGWVGFQQRWWRFECEEIFVEHADDLAEARPHVRIFNPARLSYISKLCWSVFRNTRPLLLQIRIQKSTYIDLNSSHALEKIKPSSPILS